MLGPQHGDLTAANILLHPHRIGIVDWESGTSEGVLFTDDWYLLADIAARTTGTNHAAVVHRLGLDDDLHARFSAQIDAAGVGLGWSQQQRRLAFDQCWLAHAADEVDRGHDGPFLAVLRRLAQRH